MKRELRPSEIVIRDEICRRLAGGESLRAICRDEGFPSAQTVLVWAREEAGEGNFAEQYARARKTGYELLAEEILEISDESKVEANYQGEDVTLDLSGVAVQRNKLRVDTRKWLLSKMLPKVYGDKIAHEVGGVDGGPIVTQAIVVPEHDPIAASQAYQQFVDPK